MTIKNKYKINREIRINNCLNRAIRNYDNNKIKRWQLIFIRHYEINYNDWFVSQFDNYSELKKHLGHGN